MRSPYKVQTPLAVAAVFLVFAVPSLWGQKMDQKPLDRDIAIMEKILDRLLNQFEPRVFSSRLARGLYLPDYGLLFTVGLENQTLRLQLQKLVRNSQENLTTELKALERAQKSLMLQIRKLSEEGGKGTDVWKNRLMEVEEAIQKRKTGLEKAEGDETRKDEDIQKWFRDLDRKILTFLGTYVDRGNFLKKRQKAGVVVFLNEDGSVEDLPRARFYSVPVSAIRAYRMGGLNEAAFARKVSIQNVDGEYGEQIGILSSVLKWTLQDLTEKKDFWFTPYRVMGFYLKGVGTIYLLRGWFDPDMKVVVTRSGEKREKKVIQLEVGPSPSLQKPEQLKMQLIQVLGAYGPTLRFLKKKESIFLLIQHASYGTWLVREVRELPIPSLIQVRKRDLDAYATGKISLEELARRAVVR